MRLPLLILLLHSGLGLVQPPRRASTTLITHAQAARTGKRQRVADWFRRRRRQDAESEPAPGVLAPLSQLERDTSLSVTCWKAMVGLKAPETLADRRLAFRVGKKGAWTLVTVDDSLRVAVEIEDSQERPVVDAAITYASEDVFEALMDESYSSAAAVATGRLRISGSVRIASKSEPLFDAVDAKLRATRAVAVGGAEAAAARRKTAEVAFDARLREAAARPRIERWRARHFGTDQQIASSQLVLGGALYVLYCVLALDASNAVDVLPNTLYLASALLWLLGSGALVQGSYPENVLDLAKKTEADAADDGRRRDTLSRVERYCTDSAVLVGAYGLGVGAPTFLAGAAAAIAAHPGDVVPILYAIAGGYIVFATALLVYGALPDSLAANSGSGSTALRDLWLAPPTPSLRLRESWTALRDSRYTETDVVAGAWAFAAFMVACLLFGMIDLVAEPSSLAALFAVSQVPFAAGALALAEATYPENTNRVSTGDSTRVLDEMMLRMERSDALFLLE